MGTSDKPGPHACSTCRRQRPETLRAGDGEKPLPVSSLPKGEPEGSGISLTIPGGIGGLPGGLNGPIVDHMEQGADSPCPHIVLGGPARARQAGAGWAPGRPTEVDKMLLPALESTTHICAVAGAGSFLEVGVWGSAFCFCCCYVWGPYLVVLEAGS